jgi:hypothetical protein
MARACGLIERKPEAAIDATGLESRHASRHYLLRRAEYRPFVWRHWPKLTLVCHTRTHLIVGAVFSQGPSGDSGQFGPAVRQASRHLPIDRLLGDTAYDGEHNHRLAREDLGIRSTLIPLNRRNTGRRWPKTTYRREMKTNFDRLVYGQRWQVESTISRHKRRLGSALRNRREASQERESFLRIVTHDLMILRRAV